jgi:hypothetical protein
MSLNAIDCRGSIGLAVAIAVMGLVSGCATKPRADSPALFPASAEISAWTRTGEPRVFQAADLWQYNDGDAERYRQAGVQQTLTANYRYADSFDALAEIHVMATPDGAKKIMESEPALGSQPVALGDSGRLYGASLIFRKGPCLVRLVAYRETPEVGKALMELARGIEKKLAQQRARQS